MLEILIFLAVLGGSVGYDEYLRPTTFWDEFGVEVYPLSDFFADQGVQTFDGMEVQESLAVRILSGKKGEFGVYITCPHHEQDFYTPKIPFVSDATFGRVYEQYIVIEKPPNDSLSVRVIHEDELREFLFVDPDEKQLTLRKEMP